MFLTVFPPFMPKDRIAPVDLHTLIFRSQKRLIPNPTLGFLYWKIESWTGEVTIWHTKKTHQRLLVFNNIAILKMLGNNLNIINKNFVSGRYLLYCNTIWCKEDIILLKTSILSNDLFFWKKSYIWKMGPGNQHWSFNEARKRINKL